VNRGDCALVIDICDFVSPSAIAIITLSSGDKIDRRYFDCSTRFVWRFVRKQAPKR
jgi:hypothetical protein